MARLLTHVVCLFLLICAHHIDSPGQQLRRIDGPPGGSFDQVHISRIKQDVIYAYYVDPAGAKPSVTYVTTNGGVNWRPIFTEDLPSTYVGPNFTTIPWGDSDLELVEYMHGDTLIYGYDQGTRWEKVQTNVALTNIFIHPKVQRIRVGRNGRSWYRSLDIGSTWDSIPTPPIDGQLAFAPSDVKTVYLYSGQNLYVSNDTASTWTLVNYSNVPFMMREIVVDQADPNYLVAACGEDTRWSADGGKTWTVNSSVFATRVVQHPQQPNKWFAWRSRIWGSNDGGRTWEMIEPAAPAATDIDAYRDVIVTGGLYDQIRAMNEDGSDPRIITGDIRRMPIIDDGIGRKAITDSRRLHTVHEGLIYLAGVYDIARTSDKGDTWTLHNPSDTNSPWRPEILSIASSTQQAGLLFAVSNAVYRSVDSGGTWSMIRTLPPIQQFSIVALSPIDAQHVIVSGQGVVQRSTDQGQTWGNVTPPNLFHDDATPTRMEISRASDASWILTSKGRFGNRQIHVTTDAGVTWKSQAEPHLLFLYATLEIYPDIEDPKTFYVCGIDPARERADYMIITTDGGATWRESTMPSTAFLLPAREPNSLQWSINSYSAVTRQHPNGTWHQQRSDSSVWIRCADNLPNSQILMASRDELYVFEPDILVSVGENDQRDGLNSASARLVYSDDGWIRLPASVEEIEIFDVMGRKIAKGPYAGSPGVYLIRTP